MSRHYRVAGVQFQVEPNLEDNYERILSCIEWASQEGARFCLFPEMALTGYHGDFCQQEVDRALEGIAAASAQHRVTTLVGTGMKEEGNTYIQVRIYSETGDLVGFHAKMVPTCGDRRWCVPGTELKTFKQSGLVFGVLICNDLWVTPGFGPYPDPRLCYQLGQQGAEVVFQAINSDTAPEYRHYHESNLELRARESGFYIVTANAAKGEKSANCTSGVVDPTGHWQVRTERVGEQAYVADIEIED